MARIRTIKPEFPQSESMGNVSRDARLCFIMLWTIADDSGRLRGNSRMLASLLFPYDDDAPALIDGWLFELEHEGCIDRYVADGSAYVEIAKWLSHQKIDKPTPSKIPAFDPSSRILANPRESSPLDQGPKDQRIKDQGPEEPAPRKRSTPPVFELPDWINREHWDAWHSCAKRRKASAEQKALAVAKLETWRKAGQDFAGALENAAVGGYQGLFLPDAQKAGNSTNGKQAESFRVQDKKAAEQRWAAFTGNSRDVFDVTPEILELEHVDTNQSH